MADKITTFKYHWYNCGLSNADDVQHCEVAIYRNLNLLTILLDNGYKKRVGIKRLKLNKEQTNGFFEFLELNEGNWRSDYRIETCDGSEWTIQLYHSSHKVTKICGSVDNLPQIDEFREHISLLADNDEMTDVSRYLG